MTDTSDGATISNFYAAAMPPVQGKPLRRLPRSLYSYVCQTSARQQVVLCMLTLLVFPLTLAPLELQRRIIDEAIDGGNPRLLAVLASIYLAAILTLGILKYLRNLYAARIQEGIARILRRRFSGSLGSDAAADDGTRQSILAVESEKIGGFVSESLAFPLLQAGIILSVSGYMLAVDPLVAVTALFLLVPAVVVVMVTQPAMNRLSEEKITETRALGEDALVEETGRPLLSESKSQRHIGRIYRLRLRFAAIKFMAKGINNTLHHLGPLSVLAVGGWYAIQGETEVGTIVAFMSGYERMTGPVRDLLNFYRRLAMMRVQYGLVYQAGRTVDGG